jgi:hypothetical protein
MIPTAWNILMLGWCLTVAFQWLLLLLRMRNLLGYSVINRDKLL